jgi:glycine dehydrogenase subunit 1
MWENYIPHTNEDVEEMLKAIGVEKIDDLFKDIPQNLRFKGKMKLDEPLDDINLLKLLRGLADKNASSTKCTTFLGGGIYNHFIPPSVLHLASLPEFFTAYTPYQAEMSQGSLRTFFEFQTMICELTGMEVANASMYDGASALAEAMLMASRVNKKYKHLIASNLNPDYIQVVKSYAKTQGIEIIEVNYNKENGEVDLEDLQSKLNDDISSVMVGYPNYFGIVENLKKIRKLSQGKMMIVVPNPIALGILEAPAKLGADIVVGDGQTLGNPMSFGGPTYGFFATNKKYMRTMPGRLIGKTVDDKGNIGYVMTLQAREQHIRREKATSNICSNHALMAAMSTFYMATMGKSGIKKVAYDSLQKAHYLALELERIGYKLEFIGPFFNEFVVRVDDANSLKEKLFDNGILAPVVLDDTKAMFAVTEVNTKDEMDRLVSLMEGLK